MQLNKFDHDNPPDHSPREMTSEEINWYLKWYPYEEGDLLPLVREPGVIEYIKWCKRRRAYFAAVNAMEKGTVAHYVKDMIAYSMVSDMFMRWIMIVVPR